MSAKTNQSTIALTFALVTIAQINRIRKEIVK